MNQNLKLLLALVIALCVIFVGSVGSTYFGFGGSGSPSYSKVTTHSTTLTQTAVIISTEMISDVTTETTASTTIVTSTSVVSISPTQSTSPTTSQTSSSSATGSPTSTSSATSSTESTFTTSYYYTTTTSASSTISQSTTSISTSSTSTSSITSSTTTSSTRTTSTSTTTTSSSSTTTLLGIVVSLNCTPSTLQPGSSTLCIAKVTDASHSDSTPTGKISFTSKAGGSFVPSACTLIGFGSTAGCFVSFYPSSSSSAQITLSASYPGDLTHASGASSFDVSLVAAGSASIACTPSAVAVSTRVSCSAIEAVSGSLPPPSGTFTFSSNKPGAFDPPSCDVDPSGSCSVSYTPDSGSEGVATISASYGGDQNYPPNGATTQLTITQISTNVQLNCNPDTVSVNQTVACDASVQNAVPGTNGDPSGSVSVAFNSGSSSCILNNGRCSVTFVPKSTGQSITVIANYAGDVDHAASSGNATIIVMLKQSSLDLNCNPDNVLVNQPTTCTAVVNGNGPGPSNAPTGTVQFSADFGSSSCTLAPAQGSASSCSVTLTPGPGTGQSQHVITATYSGDAAYSSNNQNTNLNVNQRSVSTTVSCSPNPVAHGFATTCTVTVTDTGGVGSPVTPSGTVFFQSNSQGTFSGSSCTLKPSGASGTASCSVAFTPNSPGNADINVNYSGDSDHQQNRGQTKLGVT